MNDRAAAILFYALILLLPLAALIARRPSTGQTVKMALAWVGIFAIGIFIVNLLG